MRIKNFLGDFMRILRIFLKIIGWFLVFVLIIICLTSIYIVTNKKKLSDKFLATLKEQVSLDIKYSDFDISLIKHFPFSALTFEDLTLGISSQNQQTEILSAKKISLTVNSVNLINGNFNIRNCIVEEGVLNYYPNKIDSLLNRYTREANATSKQKIVIKRFILKDYMLNVYNNKNKLSVKIHVNNSLIFLSLNNDNLHTSIKAELANFYTDGFQVKFPTKIRLNLNKTNNHCVIENIDFEINKVFVTANGEVNLDSGAAFINYTSNAFSIQNLQEILSLNYEDIAIRAKTKVSGRADFNLYTSKINSLVVNHTSKGKVISNDKSLIINELIGQTRLTNNFNNHITSISKANIEFNNLSAILSAKIKGLGNPVILTEGLIKLNHSKHDFLDRMATISATGNIKMLISIKQTPKQFDIKYHNMDGFINFDIEAIDGIKKITDLKGTISLQDDINIESSGNFDAKPFKLNILQRDLISILNNKIPLSPEILVNAEEIDVFYITEVISGSPKIKESKANNNTYRVKVDTKHLKYMNYVFQNVSCGMLFTNNSFEIQNFKGQGFEGTLSGSMFNSENKYFINTTFERMNISKLFNHYNNFKQTIVTHDNISGDLSGSAILNFTTNNTGEIEMNSIKMESDITISNGKLEGMNKIEKLSKWLKLNQVKSIDFKTLHNKIEISNGCVKIPKMDVHSNVINLQLSGEHFFNGNFNYLMKINVSQVLSRRLLNTSFTNDKENTTNGSINLYLKLFGDSNNYEVKLDKKSSFENIRNDIEAEGKTLKEIFREEFNQITKKDTILKSFKDTSLSNKTKFNIEWDEYDTLDVDNN